MTCPPNVDPVMVRDGPVIVCIGLQKQSGSLKGGRAIFLPPSQLYVSSELRKS